MSIEARAIIQANIADAEERLEHIHKELEATKRKRGRLGEDRERIKAEIQGLYEALETLGGPLPDDLPDQETQ